MRGLDGFKSQYLHHKNMIPKCLQILKDSVPQKEWKRYKKFLLTYCEYKKNIEESNLTKEIKDCILLLLYKQKLKESNDTMFENSNSFLKNVLYAIHSEPYNKEIVTFIGDFVNTGPVGNKKYPYLK